MSRRFFMIKSGSLIINGKDQRTVETDTDFTDPYE